MQPKQTGFTTHLAFTKLTIQHFALEDHLQMMPFSTYSQSKLTLVLFWSVIMLSHVAVVFYQQIQNRTKHLFNLVLKDTFILHQNTLGSISESSCNYLIKQNLDVAVTAQVIEFQSLIWDSWMEFSSSSFGLNFALYTESIWGSEIGNGTTYLN